MLFPLQKMTWPQRSDTGPGAGRKKLLLPSKLRRVNVWTRLLRIHAFAVGGIPFWLFAMMPVAARVVAYLLRLEGYIKVTCVCVCVFVCVCACVR